MNATGKGFTADPGERRCTARSKRSGEQCGKWAVNGRSVCRFHGGATPRGIAAPNFVHGRYSRSLPERLAARYQEAKADPQLLELRDEIALVDALIATLTETLGASTEVEQTATWEQIGGWMDRRMRLVRSESRRLVQMRQVLTAEQAMAFVAALAESVRRNVPDPAARATIAADMARAMQSGDLAKAM